MLSGTSFCNILQITLELELIDTLMHRLTILGTFFHGALSATTANADSPDNKTLFGFVSKTSCFIRSCWSWCTMHSRQLTKMPASNT